MDSVQAMASTASGPSAILDMAQEWKGMGESMVKSLVDCFSGIESREKNLRLVSESLATRSRDLEEREREFEELKLLQEGRSEELSLREEKLDEQLRLIHEHIESLEASQGEVEGLRGKEREKLKEIEKRERELDVVRGLLERRLDEVGKRLKEFDVFHNGKLEELALKEEILCKEKGEFVEEVKVANEKLKEKQRLGYGLIERLESALDMLGGMKVIMDEKFKEIELRETMAHESLTSRLNEADLIRESLEKRFKELEDIEKELNFSQGDKTEKLESREQQLDTTRVGTVKLRGEKSSEQQKLGLQMVENKPEEMTQELELKQGNMVSCKKEHDYEEHDCREKNLSSVRESPQTYVKENLALSKLDQPQRQLVGTQAEVVADKGQRVCRSREVELEGKLHGVHFKEQGSKQSILTDTTHAHLTIKPDKSVDLGQALQKDRETLEMLIIDPEKDLGLIDGEICKILSLSSDPAKLVLDTVQGFYTLRSGKLDTECKVRRATILLLDQLTKMSSKAKIQPCVTVAAIKLAFEWKSKLSTTVEDPMEVLGFLHLVAAFDLSSRFDKMELFSFLKLVGQHKQTPKLCHTLGLAAKIPEYIQNLINGKEYLLASTYVYEYQFQHRWKQGAILNYYVAHSKCSANTKARGERNTSEARDKAIASEIADLRVAVAHIIKYGLESEYSPNVLTARIQQLEVNRASLKHGCPSTSADIQKQGNSKRSGYPNKRKARRKLRQAAARGPAAAPNPQMPCDGSNRWSASPAWRAQHHVSNTETLLVASPAGFSYPWAHVNPVPMPHPGPDGPYKRHRPDVWLNGDHLGQFGNQH